MSDLNKEYGPHEFVDTSDKCIHGCGCWLGLGDSGGPIGLGPSGKCPNNPKDGKRLAGDQDHRNVVEQLIYSLNLQIQETKTKFQKTEEELKIETQASAEICRKLVKAKEQIKKIREISCDV